MKELEDMEQTQNAPLYRRVVAVVVALGFVFYYFFANFYEGARYYASFVQLCENALHFLKMITPAGLVKPVVVGLTMLFYFGSVYLAGRLISGVFMLSGGSVAVIVARFGLGAGAMSFFMLALGLAGALRREIIIIAFVFPYILSAKWFFRLRDRSAAIRSAATEFSGTDTRSLFSVAAAGIVLLFLLFGFIGALVPPTDVDGLMYHLAAPALYLDRGVIYHVPYMLTSGWPQGMEMLYLGGMGIGGDAAARAVNFGIIALCCLAVFGLASRFSRRDGAIAATAAFISIPIVHVNFFMDNVEPLMVLYELLALCAFVDWRERGENRNLYLCALFCGLTVTVKFLGIIFCAVMLLAVIAAAARGPERKLKNVFLFALIAATPAAPWLLKSWIWTGNPVWPFFYKIFGGTDWSAINDRDYSFFMFESFRPATLKSYLTAIPDHFRGAWTVNIGAAAPVLFPFLFAVRRPPRRALFLLAFSFILFAAWNFTSPQPRHLMAPLAIFCAAVSVVFAQRRTALKLLLAALVLFHLVVFASAGLRNIPSALGGESDADFHRLHSAFGTFDMYDTYQFADENLPDDAVLLLLWDSQGFYCPRKYIWGDPLDQGYIRYFEYGGDAALLDRLHSEGVTHVVFSARGLAAKQDLDMKLREKFGLAPGDPTAVYSVVPFQKRMIRNGVWRKVYGSPNSLYYIFEIVYPPGQGGS